MFIALIVIGCILIFLQILSIIGGGVPEVFVNISSVDQFLYDLLYCFGFYFIGILGLGLLILGVCMHNRKKRKPKLVSSSPKIAEEKNFTEEDNIKSTSMTDCTHKDEATDTATPVTETKQKSKVPGIEIRISSIIPIVLSAMLATMLVVFVVSYYDLRAEHDELQDKNEHLNEELSSMEYTAQSQLITIEFLNDEIEELEEQIEELEDQVEELKNKNKSNKNNGLFGGPGLIWRPNSLG